MRPACGGSGSGAATAWRSTCPPAPKRSRRCWPPAASAPSIWWCSRGSGARPWPSASGSRGPAPSSPPMSPGVKATRSISGTSPGGRLRIRRPPSRRWPSWCGGGRGRPSIRRATSSGPPSSRRARRPRPAARAWKRTTPHLSWPPQARRPSRNWRCTTTVRTRSASPAPANGCSTWPPRTCGGRRRTSAGSSGTATLSTPRCWPGARRSPTRGPWITRGRSGSTGSSRGTASRGSSPRRRQPGR